MKAMISILCGVLAMGLSLAPNTSSAADIGPTPAAYTALATKAQAAGYTQAALFFQEQALVASVGQPAVFGPAAGRYWQSISQTGDWGRAYDFFARLKTEYPDDSDVLANYGNAIGGLFGMLGPAYGNKLSSGFYESFGKSAMQAYAHALNIQPDNFTALLGRAIFLSYTPDGMTKAETGFKHILSLRKSRPYYPYALVYKQWAAALTRNGQKAEARKVIEKGKAALGAAAFSSDSGV